LQAPDAMRVARALPITAAAAAGAAFLLLSRWPNRRDPAEETARVRDLYDREADRYDSVIGIPERLLFTGGREWAAAQATGRVLEIGIGTGRNLPHYPAGMRVAGQDISPAMLARARARARALGRRAPLAVGDAQHLSFADAQFDTVVSTLTLCTIPDERRALAEARRVLRPGGRLILLEHVRSPRPVVRAVQRAIDPLTVRFAGDHLLRDPLDHLAALGFAIEFCARSRAGIVERVVARKPG
jgi:ubiquinone/menaquinone biosynthesis C-methylase UbiE